jgi:acyl carrier protein
MRVVGAGVTGDLYVGSENPARCYVGRAAETAERLVPDPYGETPGARLYRTGDVGRRLRDGRIEHLGRADGQAKVRGMRVELKGVEAALLRQPEVREAVVLARTSNGNGNYDGSYSGTYEGTYLAAYVVWREGERMTAAELRKRLRTEVAEQMVPESVVVLKQMPLLPNGKVDRRALPEPTETAEVETGGTAPRTPAEELIAGIWREVLGTEHIGVHDNFFDLGGHSLALSRVNRRLRELFSVEVPLVELFRNPTVGALAKHFETGNDREAVLRKSSDRAGKRKSAIGRHTRRA